MVIQTRPQEKQVAFFKARARFVAYGGARGGGKSWSVREKARLLSLRYGGIRILILRRSFPELQENHILPMKRDLMGLAVWRETEKAFTFPNGSRIKFGYCAGEHDVDQYQGQEYDIIFIDEATQFTEYQYQTLTACLRGANDFPKRMYLTCNPGGVGHAWVKRLFIDRDYRESEVPEDYVFISAKVTDNPALMEADPGYVRMLDNLPPGLREAWRDGSWDVFAGQYFTEWNRDVHVCDPFTPPDWWRWYVTMDYGLDMLAAYLIGVDEEGRAWVVREVYQGKDLGNGADGLIISEAAERVKELADGVRIYEWLAPPDLWNRRQETGRSVADIFAEHGVYLTKTSNDRVAGWLAVKEWLKIEVRKGAPSGSGAGGEGFGTRLRIFRGCVNLIRCLPQLQYDDKNPSDVATQPHELTHGPDALRGFCVYWTTKSGGRPEKERPKKLIERLGAKSRVVG